MTVENTASYIPDLNIAFPRSRDLINEGDDHIRLIKYVLKNTFPQYTTPILHTSTAINNLHSDIGREGNVLMLKRDLTFAPNIIVDATRGYITNVGAVEDSTAVQPRSYNDNRYLRAAYNLSDLPNKDLALATLLSGASSLSSDLIKSVIFGAIYPIGSLYFNASNSQNPATLLGFGTWVNYAQGRAVIGVGSHNDGRTSRTFSAEATGGYYNHTLTTSEMPSHSHGFTLPIESNGRQKLTALQWDADDCIPDGRFTTDAVGNDTPHNNTQPYIAVYIWKRTA